MVLAVPPDKVQALGEIADREDVLMCDLGHYGTDGEQLILTYDGTEVGRLSMDFLHNGLPQPTREAHWAGPPAPATASRQAAHAADDLGATLIELLGHPNIASKHWIIRQYDHEVQGGAAVRPLTGSRHDGPADAAVLRPKLDSQRGVAVSCGLATTLGDVDPYWMALAAIDEAVRNAVCAGARADRIAILDNFCWPSCDSPDNLGSLVRAAEACYDGAIAYRTPFISGKDSLNNQFTTDDGRTIAIPPTLLISAVGIVDDVDRCVTMDAKAADDILLQVGATTGAMGVSHFELVGGACGSSDIPRLDLDTGPRTAAAVAELIGRGLVGAAHDCSEGGMLVAAAEMAFAGDLGLAIDLAAVPAEDPLADHAACFAETPGRYLIEIPPHHFDEVVRALRQAGVAHGEIGTFNTTARLTVRSAASGRLADVAVDELRQAWRQPLDW
jgi:phosphoribosylformylglycinamidine synthase